MPDDNDDISIDPNSLIKRLAPDQLGLFEPISAIMLLNVEEEDFQAMAQRFQTGGVTEQDSRLIATINHETYHFAQTAVSGYMFDRQRTAFGVLNACEEPPALPRDPDFDSIITMTREGIGDDPEANAYIDSLVEMADRHSELEALGARASPTDPSWAGAVLPGFFAHLEQRRQLECVANSDGLSILGVIEGSAVIFTNLLTYHAHDPLGRLRDELATLGPPYGELLAAAGLHAGDRAVEVALPAAALALYYERPHDACCALLPMIASAPAGKAVSRGRALFEAPPAIDAAGAWLGDALARRADDDSYRIYDPFHARMRSGEWGIDCYDLLADPQAMNRVGSFPMGTVTRSGFRGPFEDRNELIARMAIMSLVLKVLSRRRLERDHHATMKAWALGLARRSSE